MCVDPGRRGHGGRRAQPEGQGPLFQTENLLRQKATNTPPFGASLSAHRAVENRKRSRGTLNRNMWPRVSLRMHVE